MSKNLLFKNVILMLVILPVGSAIAQNQEAENNKINFRYSQNPKIRNKDVQKQNLPPESPIVATNTPTEKPDSANIIKDIAPENVSIAKKTLDIAKRANSVSIVPTEIYKVGIGDVLFINLQNASRSASYFTVLNDGTIDYPLTGELLPVAGLTTEEIEDALKEKIKLYENPQISVKVREYSSHSINVLGMVEKAGEKKIQREAVPLFLIKADAIVQSKANQAIVRRTNSTVETLDLKDSKTDDVLIFPGDIVEFGTSEKPETAKITQFYYIGGEITAGGQKDFHQGITLTQAILASGGLRRMTVRKVIIRRKNAEGILVSTEYNLKNIKDGKEPDPSLQSDDTIEIGL